MGKRYDIVIVGGGAAGLSAAVFACRAATRPLSVLILEKSKRVGRKLLATGNGTCNITNIGATAARYHGGDAAYITALLDRFSPQDALDFFASIGVVCEVRADGKAYPVCEQAGAVLDCLRLSCAAYGVEERCEAAVTAIKPHVDEFTVTLAGGETISARKVLVCAGGAASPSLGGGNDGYSLLTVLGHTRRPLFPSIVQVCTDTEWIKSIKGIRVQATVQFCHNGKPLARQNGEVLFTEYGLSGPAVMQISRFVGDWERRKDGTMTAVLDLLPEWDGETLYQDLSRRTALQGRTREDYFTGFLNKRVGQTLLRCADLSPLSLSCDTLTDRDVRRLTALVKAWEIPVRGTKGMAGAQVTAGGTAVEEFNRHTMESKRVSGLYAAGEVLDIDGDCGGFNLQYAWASAYVAAQSMVKAL